MGTTNFNKQFDIILPIVAILLLLSLSSPPSFDPSSCLKDENCLLLKVGTDKKTCTTAPFLPNV